MAYFTQAPAGTVPHSFYDTYNYPSPSLSAGSTLHSSRSSTSPQLNLWNEFTQSPSPRTSPASSIGSTRELFAYSSPTQGHYSNSTQPESPSNGLDSLLNINAGDSPYTLKTLMQYAIQGSSKKKLTVNQIYEAIENRYPDYRSNPTWRKSARRELTKDPSFVKIDRPILDPGRGSYWTYDPSRAVSAGRRASHSQAISIIKAEDSSLQKARRSSRSVSIVDRSHPGSMFGQLPAVPDRGRLIAPSFAEIPVIPAAAGPLTDGFIHYSFPQPNQYSCSSGQVAQRYTPYTRRQSDDTSRREHRRR